MKKKFFLIALLAILIAPVMSFAATLTPGSYSATINVGETVTIEKTVQLDSTGPAISKVDVFFLADNTGSMGGIINTVKSNAAAILNAISGGDSRFAGVDIQYGVGRYLGDPSEGVSPTTAYQLISSMTTSKTNTQNAINTWYASGGGDYPEANFFALKQVADSAGTGWRADAGKVIVWFGDAQSHIRTTTEAQAIAALNARGIKVAAINTEPAGDGIDDAGGSYWYVPAYGAHQAQHIADSTGGTLTNGVSGTAAVEAIYASIASAISKVNLSLITSGDTSGLSIDFTPDSFFDVFPGESRTFSMSITGLTPGTYDFETRVVGVSTAPEYDHIVVRDPHPRVPEPSTMLMIGSMLMGFVFTGKKKFMK